MKPSIGINDAQRAAVVEILNALLADEYLLYTKTRNYHWNVVGPQFNDLHKVFAEQYEAIDEFIDDVAERARTLGGHAVATLAELAEAARLKEHPGQYPGADEALRADLKTMQRMVRVLKQLSPGADVQGVVDELIERTEMELDYRLEADNQRAFAKA